MICILYEVGVEKRATLLTLSTGIDGHALHRFQNEPIIGKCFYAAAEPVPEIQFKLSSGVYFYTDVMFMFVVGFNNFT